MRTLAPSRVEISAGSAVKSGLLKSACCIFRDEPITVAPVPRKAWVTYVPRPPFAGYEYDFPGHFVMYSDPINMRLR